MFKATWYLTSSLCLLMRYRVEHSKRNTLSPHAHVLGILFYSINEVIVFLTFTESQEEEN